MRRNEIKSHLSFLGNLVHLNHVFFGAEYDLQQPSNLHDWSSFFPALSNLKRNETFKKKMLDKFRSQKWAIERYLVFDCFVG